jgi:hypothetical protein
MDKDLQEDLQKLQAKPSGMARLPAAGNPDAIGPHTAFAASGGRSDAGIASPLTEAQYTDREWHPPRVIYSTDGLFSIRLRHIKTLKMADAADNEVVFEFADFSE